MKDGRPSSPRRFRSFDDEDDSGASQLDVAVSFLGILVLYLVVQLVVEVASGGGSAESRYRVQDVASVPADLRSFQPIYRFRDFWLIQNGHAARLDFPGIAQRLAKEGGPGGEMQYADGTIVRLSLEGNPSPTGSTLFIRRPVDALAFSSGTGPYDRVLPLDTPAGEVASAFPSAPVLYIWRDEILNATPLIEALVNIDRSPRVRPVLGPGGCDDPRSWCMFIVYSQEAFAMEALFR